MNISRFIYYLHNLQDLQFALALRYPKLFSDKQYLKILFRKLMGSELNLECPQTFSEKLQWLKLYNHNPQYTQMVDKYEAKKYVANIIGEEYIIPTLAVYNSTKEINLDTLPDKFVLKCTHDSGSVAICKDKKTFQKEKALELSTYGEISPADIENEPFILPVEGNDTEEQEIMKTFAHKPPVRYRLNDDLSVMAMVSGGFGLTLMPEMLLAHTRFSFAVRPMEPPAYRLIGIASLPEERISLLTIRFMEYLAELAADGMFGKSAGGQPDRAERESGTSKPIECVKNRLNLADNSDKIK